MSAATSPGTGLAYGLRRVCAAWGMARSSFYAMTSGQHAEPFTVDDGWGWIFTAVEHWNAECVGWHVCKRGDRFAALQPISMGLAGLYGSTAAGAARGLALRMDHGSQYLSDHFTNQIKFWGIQPSYAFVAEPQSRRQSVGDRSPRSRTRRCWWRSKPTWRHRPGRARATARSGLGFGSVATSGLPASGCSA